MKRFVVGLFLCSVSACGTGNVETSKSAEESIASTDDNPSLAPQAGDSTTPGQTNPNALTPGPSPGETPSVGNPNVPPPPPPPPPRPVCTADTFTKTCSGNILTVCDSGNIVTQICGNGCYRDASGTSACIPRDCGSETLVGRCTGQTAIYCQNNHVFINNCSTVNRLCERDGGGFADCFGSPLTQITTTDGNGATQVVACSAGTVQGTGLTYTLQIGARAAYTVQLQIGADGRSRIFSAIDSANHTLGSITFDAGRGVTLVTPSGALGGAFGPFVLRPADLQKVSDVNLFVLLDSVVLRALPMPRVAVRSGSQAAALQVYNTWIGSTAAQDLLDTFRFRDDITALTASQRQGLAAVMEQQLASQSFVDLHMQIDHGTGLLDPGAVGSGGMPYALGGFLNGHRTYMRQMEAYVAENAGSGVVPFRRLPAFDPAGSVPTELMHNVANGAIEVPLPAEWQPGAFPNDTDESSFGLRLSIWHGAVHNAAGGLFANLMTAPTAPLFYLYHTALDVVWDTYRLERVLIGI